MVPLRRLVRKDIVRDDDQWVRIYILFRDCSEYSKAVGFPSVRGSALLLLDYKQRICWEGGERFSVVD
jgi:hypothetical protein